LVDAIAKLSPALLLDGSLRGALATRQSTLRRHQKVELLASLAMTAHHFHPNFRLRHSISFALTSSGFSCWVQ
jgi:hypothetical protein